MLLDSFLIHFKGSFGFDLDIYGADVTEHPSQQKVQGELITYILPEVYELSTQI